MYTNNLGCNLGALIYDLENHLLTFLNTSNSTAGSNLGANVTAYCRVSVTQCPVSSQEQQKVGNFLQLIKPGNLVLLARRTLDKVIPAPHVKFPCAHMQVTMACLTVPPRQPNIKSITKV